MIGNMENVNDVCRRFWNRQQRTCRLPRWSELPDIELYMDQVITYMNKFTPVFTRDGENGLTPSMINNYVKLNIIPPPVKKKYSRVHLSRLIMICAMKPVLSIQLIGALIEYMLKSRSEEELLDFFAEQYEHTYIKITDILRSSVEEITDNDTNISRILALTVMQAAAVSCGSKILAENALAEMQHLNVLIAPSSEAAREKKEKEAKKREKEKERELVVK